MHVKTTLFPDIHTMWQNSGGTVCGTDSTLAYLAFYRTAVHNACNDFVFLELLLKAEATILEAQLSPGILSKNSL